MMLGIVSDNINDIIKYIYLSWKNDNKYIIIKYDTIAVMILCIYN